MSDKEIYNKIKSIVHSFLPGAQVLLFGSRVKSQAHKDSDYDLLIVKRSCCNMNHVKETVLQKINF